MTANGVFQIVLYFGLVVLLVKPLGLYMAHVFNGQRTFLDPVLRPVERVIYWLGGVDPRQEQHWTTYTAAMLLFNLAGLVLLYALQRLQHVLPFNPQGFDPVGPDLAFNTAVSFTSNTNWQAYSGESTMIYLVQMAGLTVQNFASAATGIALAVALIRAFARHSVQTLGNFWVDLVRSTLWVLLPISLVLALVLVWQGVPQNLQPYVTATTVEGASQTIAQGPVASQEAIKELGTNGGGFFNANSAHPYENPTPLTNLLEMLAIFAIGAALTYTFGRMVGDQRQGWAIFGVMAVLFFIGTGVAYWAEAGGNPALDRLGVNVTATDTQAGGNMEGKETRFGIANSALWATATTAASNGSVNSMHDSYTPLGGLVPMWLIQLGEVVFGGVGSGLYGMLVFAIIAVFVAGLMIGRTPEYLGKKIEAFEMKMASIVILIPPLLVLAGTAVAVLIEPGKTSIFNPGAHGFSEVLYAFSSAGNNNGSAFAGLSANTPFYNTALGLAMWFGRFWLLMAVLAIAGSLAAKKRATPGVGTLPTHGPLFIAWLVGIVLMVGALTFLPALALGPIVEHLNMAGAP